jgi:hypothetical protein
MRSIYHSRSEYHLPLFLTNLRPYAKIRLMNIYRLTVTRLHRFFVGKCCVRKLQFFYIEP